MKICTKCGGEPKPVTEFSRHAKGRDGLNSRCRSCCSIAAAKWNAENPEKVRVNNAKWDAKNSDYYTHWYASNLEAYRINNHNYRARKRENGGQLSIGLAERLFKLQRGKCACGCKQPLGDDFHRDHIMPIALGGPNTDDNIQLLRSTCNHQKSAKHPVEFMRQRGYLL